MHVVANGQLDNPAIRPDASLHSLYMETCVSLEYSSLVLVQFSERSRDSFLKIYHKRDL